MTDLTIGEKVWLWRRRQKLPLLDASQRLGTTKAHLVDWEADREEPDADLRRRVLALTPTPEEELRVLRRRSGLGSRGAAQAFGVSHVHLLRLERAADPELRRWYVHMKKDADRHKHLFTSGYKPITSGDIEMAK